MGFAGGGAKLRPAPLAKEVDRLEEIPLTSVEVSVATIELIGTEGLLVLKVQAGVAARAGEVDPAKTIADTRIVR